MIEAAAEALALLAQPSRFGFLVLGVLIGSVVAFLPGMGGTVGMSVILPFLFGMDPVDGMALLIGAHAVTHTADTFSSVLIGVPGSSGSQATIMDGYPLARQGEGARALGAAFTVSMVGGLLGSVLLFAILQIARPIALALQSPELFMLALLGITMVAVLSRGAALAGLAAGALGLLLGVVGMAPADAMQRFTLGLPYLFDGVPIAVLALGLFALPEFIDLLIEDRSIAGDAKLGKGRMEGVRDAWRHKGLVGRSATMGMFLGVVPGIGAAVVDWLVYGITKQTSRNNENFGKGDIRGVIGPESANNAKESGTLVPTLLFGIPGSGSMAVLLGGLIILGVGTGPTILTRHLDVVMTIVWSLVLANILATALCFGLAGAVTRLTVINANKLIPVLVVVVSVAAYQSSRHIGDLIAMMVLGVLGWLMKRYGMPRPPMLIGFVLAISAERYLHISYSRYGFEFLTFPLVILIGVFTLVAVIGGSSGLGFVARGAKKMTSRVTSRPR